MNVGPFTDLILMDILYLAISGEILLIFSLNTLNQYLIKI